MTMKRLYGVFVCLALLCSISSAQSNSGIVFGSGFQGKYMEVKIDTAVVFKDSIPEEIGIHEPSLVVSLPQKREVYVEIFVDGQLVISLPIDMRRLKRHTWFRIEAIFSAKRILHIWIVVYRPTPKKTL